jgi:uncharacterized protein YndB with AHSA1/START domain
MTEHGVVTGAGTVRFERLLPGPIERVWAYLTESERRATWLAAGPMELRAGGRVELTFRFAELSREKTTPARYAKYDGHRFTGVVKRCDPPRVLSYTWDEESGVESEVTFELEPRGGDVLLVLTHRRLADRAAMVGVATGWHCHLDILEDRLRGVEPRPFWATHIRVEAEYEDKLARDRETGGDR